MDIERWARMADAKHEAAGAGEQSSLVARAAAGDRDAFTRLVATYHADMSRLAGVIAGDSELARDAVQNAWQRAWLRLSHVRDHAKVRSWLLSVTANEARLILRRRRPTAEIPEHIVFEQGDPARHLDNLDLNTALDRLDPRDRELLGLRYVLGFSSVELADYLSLSPEGVRSRLKRLVDRLRLELTDD